MHWRLTFQRLVRAYAALTAPKIRGQTYRLVLADGYMVPVIKILSQEHGHLSLTVKLVLPVTLRVLREAVISLVVKNTTINLKTIPAGIVFRFVPIAFHAILTQLWNKRISGWSYCKRCWR